MKAVRKGSNLKNILTEYLEQLSLNKARLTVQAYGSDLKGFIEYIGERKAAQLKGSHIEGYLGHCRRIGRSDATIRRYFDAIRSFCKWLRKHKLIEEDISDIVERPKIELEAPRVPSKQEVATILQAPDLDDWEGIRNKAILELLYSSGLRASELCNLKIGDIQGGQVFISKGKGSKPRTVPLTTEAMQALDDYIERCEPEIDRVYLWQRTNGQPITRGDLYDIVSGYARTAGVPDVTPHTLRHACATHLLEAGADLRLIQVVLGHSSISSTQRYTHLTSTNVQEMFHKFHPGGRHGRA